MFSPPGQMMSAQGDGLPWHWQFTEDWRPSVFRRSPWNPLGFSPASPANPAVPGANVPAVVVPATVGPYDGPAVAGDAANAQSPANPTTPRVRPRAFQWNPATGRAEPVEFERWDARALPPATQNSPPATATLPPNEITAPRRPATRLLTDQPPAPATN